MARLPRLTVPGFPHHVVQRGNNGQDIFVTPADHLHFLALLKESARRWDVAVHAYVLMANHFHILATPQVDNRGVSQMMQAVGRGYVRYFNDLHHRTGTLWEGRYRSTLVQIETHFWPCMAFIDLSPVRAGLVDDARDYPWSSHGHYIGARSDSLVTPHPLMWTLGNTPFRREMAYAEQVRQGLSDHQQSELAHSVRSGWVLGTPEFIKDLQHLTDRRVLQRSAGRPKLLAGKIQ